MHELDVSNPLRLTEKTQGCFWNGPELGERMSRKATEFQKKEMSRMYRGKEIFKPLNTGWIDEHVACVREWVANIFFYDRNEQSINWTISKVPKKVEFVENISIILDGKMLWEQRLRKGTDLGIALEG